MKDHPNRLKKWLLSYLLVSMLLFFLDYVLLYKVSHYLSSSMIESFLIYLIHLTVTFYFYLKITKKSIWWSLSTLFLAFFLSALCCLFITTFMNVSNRVFIDYALFPFFWIILNALFMFAGVYIEKKTTVKTWDDDVLDDLNI